MKIAILDDYQNAVRTLNCYSKISGHDVTIFNEPPVNEEELANRLKEFSVIILIRARTRMTENLIDKLGNLKLVVQTGNIGNHVDTAACHRRGILVSASSGPTNAAAELTWALILASLRNLVDEVNRNRAGKWQGAIGSTVAGKKIGLLGYGRTGKLVARYAKAFDAQVTVWGRASTLAAAKSDGLSVTADLDSLFRENDIVSVHLKLVPETRSMIKLQHLRSMPPGSLFVNTSRADIVEAGALLQALPEGRPSHAAVDVYEEEPIWSAAHPLLKLTNVLPTPHIGFVEKNTYEVYFSDAFDAVNAFAVNQPIRLIR